MEVSNPDNFLFVEKYRPKKIEDCILPLDIKKTFDGIVKSGEMQNILLSGSAGCGKTTVAKALCNELGSDVLFINASEFGNIDTLRLTVRNFGSTVSLNGGVKVVLLDEADNLNCFSGDQEVLIYEDNIIKSKKIKDLNNQNIKVISYDFVNNKEIIVSGDVFISGEKEVFEVEFEDGTKIFCTEDHKFFDEKGKETTIKNGALFCAKNSNILNIKNIKSLGIKKVYDISTNNSLHNFKLSNGVIAHNCNSTQPALRGMCEEFSNNCRFILTCNFKHKIIEPLQSRFINIDFKIPTKERVEIGKQFLKRAKFVLDSEKIKYDEKVLVELILKHFPDFRRILGELQRYGVSGSIDAGILVKYSDIQIGQLIDSMKAKNFTEVRKWVNQNSDTDYNLIFRKIYDGLSDYLEKSSIPNVILLLAEYQHKMAFSADHEICLAACMADIMLNAQFK